MRGVLSCVSSFYDPQGFAAPVLLQARHILQECWRRKMTWDTPLGGALLERWNQWKLALPLMEEFEIPRCFFSQTDHDNCIVQLHHFCDASEIGHGSVSYLRIEYPDGHVECALIMGKSRNWPIRAPTIPRLELQSAVLSVQVDKLVKKELDVSLERTFFWTDSQITLYCINNESKRFQTYVANRLNEIREYTQRQWCHCPGTLNPADDCSCSLDAQRFLECERWKRGPDFLWMKEDMWPRNRVEEIPDNNLEIKKEKTTYLTDLRPQPQSLVDELLGRYSKCKNLLRAVAWLIKFSNWLRQGRQIQNKNLTVNDLKQAKQRIVSFVQRATFSDEIDELTKIKPNGNIPKRPSVKTSRTIVKLRPMINPEDGLLRFSGRIAEAPITFDTKHQMILPQNSHVTTPIIRHFHQQLGHCGQEHLLSRLREEFWVVRARAAIKKVIGRCFQCKRQLAQRMEQVMADLPKVINLVLRLVRFILVLRRFLSTRGNVRQLRSDNGTNFVGAERELREAIEKWNLLQIEGELHQHDCEWIFHPPNAPHMSGVWERLIRSVKRATKAIIGRGWLAMKF